ncbi:MAG: polysaccharide biosynthesis tyrosine autokinase, partial [Planctomycetota bacterium]
MTHVINNNYPQDANADWDPEEEAGIDLLQLATRHFLTIVLFLLATSCLGVLYYVKAAPVFESATDIYVESAKVPELGESSIGDQLNRNLTLGATRGMIQSGLILERVLEKIDFSKLETFQEIEDPLIYLRENLARFEVPDEDSPILRITVETNNPEDCQLIASTIASEYAEFLDERNRGISNELRDLIVKAKEDLLADLKRLDNTYDEFRANAPVMWKDGNAINIHHERQLELEKSRKELLVKLSSLKAKLQKVTKAIRTGGRAYDAVYYEAIRELGVRTDTESELSEQSGPAALAKKLYEEYANLLFRERQMQEDFGPGHPDIIALRNQRAKIAQLMRDQTGQLKQALSKMGDETDYPMVYHEFLVEQVAESTDQLKRLNNAFDAEEGEANRIATYVRKDQSLRREMDRTQSLFDALVARLDEISIIQNYQGDRATVVEQAVIGKQVGPSILKIGGLSVILGGLLGMAMAYLLELRDDSFSDPKEIRRVIGVPILAHVPLIKKSNSLLAADSIDTTICTYHSPKSRAAESFRGIRNKLYFSAMREGARVLQVTSPLPGDGKSTAVSNLAVAIAKSGKSVVVVDGDCRRPRIHRVFGLEQSPGLVEVLRGECQIEDAVVFTDVEGLTVLPAGELPDNPAELIISPKFEELINKLKESFDFVLIDSPPMLAVSDGSGIAV